jgi:hypothetical protein
MAPQIIPIGAEIESIATTEDSEGGLTATVRYKGRTSADTGKVIEFDAGPHGASMTVLLPEGRLLCVTQSATMPPSAYYLEGVAVVLPDAPPEVTP